MVAYNFQQQFEPAIASGLKTRTIRRNGKRLHATRGDLLQLYVGMRTKACRKILVRDPVCVDFYKLTMEIDLESIGAILIDGLGVRSIDRFAKSDGFKNAKDMHAFWLQFHGPGRFVGTLIEWEKP